MGNVFKIINNTFYYGRFEFPKDSGLWYDGIHTPIITKELFDETRNSIKSQVIKSQGKEFAFTRIMKCGLCGSGITADEKFKKLKAGGVNRHVYYRCTKSKDRGCKNKALNETDLIKNLKKLSRKLNLDDLKVNKKIEYEIMKFKKIQAMFEGKKSDIEIKNVNIQDYFIFILREGSVLEKRSVLECVSNNILLKNKSVYVENTKS